MALSTKGLVAPDSVGSLDASRVAPGGGAAAPMWEVGDPAAVAMAGLQKSAERFADTYDDVQVGDFVMRQKKKLDDLYDNPDTGLFATRKGDAAKGMYQESKDTFKAIWDEDAKQQLSDRQRKLASKPLQAMFMDYAHRIGSHETTQLMNAQMNKVQNTVYDAKNLVASGRATMDDMTAADAIVGISVDSLAKMQGWDAATAARKKSELMGEAVVDGAMAMAAKDPTQALGFLKSMSAKYPGGIPEDKYQAALKTLDDKAQAKHLERIEGYLQSGDVPGARSYYESVKGGTGGSTSDNNLAANNFGNIKNASGGYNAYATRKDGLMAIGERVLRYNNAPERGWHAQTLFDMVNIYAPKGDGKNNPEEYAAFLGRKLGVDPNAKIDFRDPKILAGLIQYMPDMEHGAGKVNVSQTEATEAAQALLGGGKPKVSAAATADNPLVLGDSRFGTGMLDAHHSVLAQTLFDSHDKKVTAIQDDAYGRGLAQDVLRGDKNPQKIYEQLGQEFGGDLKRRDRVLNAFQSEMTNVKQMREAADMTKGLQLIADAKGLAQQDGLTIETVNDFLRNKVGEDSKDYPLIKKILRSSLARQNVLPPQADITNPVAKVNARADINNEVPFDQVYKNYGAQISETDMASIQAYSEDKEAKAANRKATAFFNEMVLKSGLNVNGQHANEDDKLFVANIKAEYDDMVSNHEFKSRDDQKTWIFHKLAKGQKDRWYWNSTYTPRERLGRTDVYVKVPDFLRPDIERMLRSEDKPVTEEAVQQAYNDYMIRRGW